MISDKNASQTYFGKTEPFELQVARGQIAGHTPVNIFGYNATVGTGTPKAIWENATAYTFPTIAAPMLVYSSSALDVNCRIVISGLNENFAPISEVVILTNGTTGVSTAKSFYRINGVLATDAAYSNPVGTIFVGNAAKTAVYGQINAGIGRSQASVYSVPAGHTFYLNRVDAYSSEAGGGSNYTNYRVSATDNVNGTTYLVLQVPFFGNYNANRVVPFAYTEKTDLQWQASAGTASSPVGIVVEGILINNLA